MLVELFALYSWTLLAGSIVSIGLALIGAQLSTRGQSAQTLVISQGSSLGIIFALGLEISTGFGTDFLALIFSFFMAALLYVICEKRIRASRPSRNSYYVGLFALLLSLTYTVTALVPSLESHMATSYFGDLAVISDLESKLMVFFGVVVLGYLVFYWRRITGASFDAAIYGQTFRRPSDSLIDLGFITLSLMLLSASIQFMGLLFTLSALMLPALSVGGKIRGLTVFTTAIALVAGLGSVFGISFSLWHGRMPTVPAVTFSFVFFGLFSRLFSRLLATKYAR